MNEPCRSPIHPFGSIFGGTVRMGTRCGILVRIDPVHALDRSGIDSR